MVSSFGLSNANIGQTTEQFTPELVDGFRCGSAFKPLCSSPNLLHQVNKGLEDVGLDVFLPLPKPAYQSSG